MIDPRGTHAPSPVTVTQPGPGGSVALPPHLTCPGHQPGCDFPGNRCKPLRHHHSIAGTPWMPQECWSQSFIHSLIHSARTGLLHVQMLFCVQSPQQTHQTEPTSCLHRDCSLAGEVETQGKF